MAASATAKPRHPPLQRQKSEAEILSYGTGDSEHVTMDTTATIISHHIQHLTFVDNKHEQYDFHDHSLGEKFHDSVNVNISVNSSSNVVVDKSNVASGGAKSSNSGENQTALSSSSSSTSPSKPPLARRASLSTLEESHLTKIGGAFDSEAEKARKARRKSFEKITRKRSGGGGSEDRERNSGGSRKDKGGKVIPTIPDG